MKRNKLIAFLLVAVTVVGFTTSCTKNFEDMNTNSLGIADDDIPLGPSYYPPMRSVVYNRNNTTWEYQVLQNLNADCFSGFMATPTAFNGGTNNLSYYMSDSWNASAYSWPYTYVVAPCVELIEKAWGFNYVEFTAVAKIMKGLGMLRLTDLFGPVPYSEYGNASESVKLDGVDEIYYQLMTEFTEASDSLYLFTTSSEFEEAYDLDRFEDYDEICGGDLTLWLRFSNTLRLRMAMRASAADPTWAKAQAEAALSAGGGLLTSGDAVVANTSSSINNPLNLITSSWLDILAGAPLVSILEGYDDPRLDEYFVGMSSDIYDENGDLQATKGEIYGIRQGLGANSDKTHHSGFSQLNIASSSSTSPLYWMKPSESYFLQAEAALRGYSGVDGTAQSLYEAGIAQAFTEYGLSVTQTYLDCESTAAPHIDPYSSTNNYESGEFLNAVPVKWMSSGTAEQQLQQIITQKWISLYPDGMEAWAEHRRTGYPKLFPVLFNYSAQNTGGSFESEYFIRRLQYPTAQYSSNPTALATAVSTYFGGDDSAGGRLWWDTNAIVTGDNGL